MLVLSVLPFLRESLDSLTSTTTMMLEKTKRHFGAMAAERMEGRDFKKKALMLEYICGNEIPTKRKVRARRVAVMPPPTFMRMPMVLALTCRFLDQ